MRITGQWFGSYFFHLSEERLDACIRSRFRSQHRSVAVRFDIETKHHLAFRIVFGLQFSPMIKIEIAYSLRWLKVDFGTFHVILVAIYHGPDRLVMQGPTAGKNSVAQGRRERF